MSEFSTSSPVRDNNISRSPFRGHTLDTLYRALWVFTHFYGASLTILFFTQSGPFWPMFVRFLESLEGPYFAGIGVYVVLKEIRKYHTQTAKGWRRGEYFVFFWCALMVIATIALVVSPQYRFDTVYHLILANGLVTFVVYIGGKIHRP